MGYAYYEFSDGAGPRGYSVEAICALPDCNEPIDKGLSYLCYGCTEYFCGKHLTVAWMPDEDTTIHFDCFAGQSNQCCDSCAEEAEAAALLATGHAQEKEGG